MTDLITRAGACLPDKSMHKYDHQLKKLVAMNWVAKDKSFDEIRSAMKQKAGGWRPQQGHIIPERTPISNQGQLGTCGANAWCDMMEILDGLEGKDKVEQLSRLFLYWVARYYVGDTDKDIGIYLRAAATQLNKIGVVEEKYFPYLENEVFTSPDLDLYTMASNNRLNGFYKPTQRKPKQLLDDLELAIRANHPFVFSAPVGKPFERVSSAAVVPTPSSDDDTSRHAMICVGVSYQDNNRVWLWRNSWGTSWGYNGRCIVRDSYILALEDIWVGTQMAPLV